MAEKVLVIERKKWRRGGDKLQPVVAFGNTYLLNNKGYMCCLGFDALACGVPREWLLGEADPESLASSHGVDALPEDYVEARLVVEHDDNEPHIDTKDIVSLAIQINDKLDMTEAEREEQLASVLKKLGYGDVQFIDGEPPNGA